MLKIVLSHQFERDLKLAAKCGYNLALLEQIVELLSNKKPLPAKNRDHALMGAFTGFRECHIQPDWLLIYRIEDEELILFLSRTGTHADLFS